MPRKSATDKNVEEKANLEETTPIETSEIKSEDSTSEETENPVETTSKRRFGYNWILVAIALILVLLFFIYFGDIKNSFLPDESQTYFRSGLFLALIISLLIWYIPKRQVKKLSKQSSNDKLTDFEREEKRLKLEDDTRKTLAQIIGGIFFILGLFVTFNTYRLGVEQQKISLQKQDLDRRGQITERFNKAVEHLGNQDLAIRLGGLYALEQILKDSPEEHNTIIEILCAFIRSKAKMNKDERKKSNWLNGLDIANDKLTINRIDIQTALSILSRRPKIDRRIEAYINLPNTNLNSAFFLGSFGDAEFYGADLSNSILSKVDFEGASLGEVNFTGANLTEANLGVANLTDADLSYTNLTDANLESANLTNANLTNANLEQAIITNAKITVTQLKAAKFDYIFIDKKKLDRESALKFLREKEGKNKKE